MKLVTTSTIAATVILVNLLSTTSPANSQNNSQLNNQSTREQIETSTTTNGCWYVPYMGWRCKK